MRLNPVVGKYARKCIECMKQMKATSRKLPPSSIEIEVGGTRIFFLDDHVTIIFSSHTQAAKVPAQLICRFYFLDGKSKALGVEPFATASDVIQLLAMKVDLQDTEGWALFEVNPERDHFIKGHEYIADILSQWERLLLIYPYNSSALLNWKSFFLCTL